MAQVRGGCRPGRIFRATMAIAIAALGSVPGACRDRPASTESASSSELRIGWGQGQASATNPNLGLRQLSQRLSFEGLARTAEDGRMLPSLAESWTPGPDGRSLTVKLRPHITFHDGSPANAEAIASIFPGAMKAFLGPLVSMVETVRASGSDSVTITFREKTPFLSESLEAPIQKPNGIGTGAFKTASNSTTELVAHDEYYLGAPALKRVHVETFPSIRTAWAEMLRDKIDMLYEVGPDALASMQNSNTVALFTYTRPYQYVLVMNPKAPVLASASIRRALSSAVDRDEIVRTALNGYGIASSGPIWPKHWAFKSDLPRFEFDPAAATRGMGKSLKLTCLMPPDAPFERIAITVKRQLAAVGVDLVPEEVPLDELSKRGGRGDYDALLIEVISGQTLFRPYLVWHSTSPLNWGKFGTSTSDAALDRLRHAQSDDDYRDAVAHLQQNFIDDPPAIFLAWSVRARAVSKRFVVPAVEPGRDVLSTIRLWKPATGDLRASRN
jgi:peptide/nickel transport system substrate-binding protein